MSRPARLVLAALAALAAGGCATKRDLRDLRAEIIALQARQDSLFAQLVDRQAILLDSVTASTRQVQRVRGDIGRQLLAIEQQLVQVQELAGQSFSRLQELRAEVDRRSQMLAQPAPEGGAAPAGDANAEQYYNAGVQALQQGAASTARRAFEQLLRDFPNDPRAPDALFGLGEAYYLEQQFDAAVTELARVAERYPASPRAPLALFRAGVIEQERGNNQAARRYFERVVSNYPSSDAAGQARDRLRRLPR